MGLERVRDLRWHPSPPPGTTSGPPCARDLRGNEDGKVRKEEDTESTKEEK